MRKNNFDLSNYHLSTGMMGQLIPVGLTEVLPNDTFRHSVSAMIRMSPMVAPVMHPLQVRIHNWFVPNRLVWDGWEDFITSRPDEAADELLPRITIPAGANWKDVIYNYFGVPDVRDFGLNALPVRAYNLIRNNFYRDQELQGETNPDGYWVTRCAWEKDYFTTARPSPQLGDAVTIPTTGETDVEVSAIRTAFAMQRYAENRARFGSRYNEYLQKEFGVTGRDARLELPEYLGGGKAQVSISEVLQTAPENEAGGSSAYGVGDMYGHGVGGLRTAPYQYTFAEHGYVLTLLSVRPKALYVDGIRRDLMRASRLDYFTPELQDIGVQTIWDGEVYAGAADPWGTFGYQDRYREYREQKSVVCGDFRETLDYWHLGRHFESEPALNASFVSCDPSDRIFNVQGEHHLWMAVQHHLQAKRVIRRTSRGGIR